jgi:hypothetical protein
VGGGAAYETDVEKPGEARRPQAAEPSDFGADLTAVLVAAGLDESDVVEDVSEELPDSLEDAGVLEASDPWCEPLRVPLPEPRRESVRESLR